MKYFYRRLSAELIITLLYFCLSFFVFSLVTDDYASFLSDCGAGQFSNYPYSKYYWGYLGIFVIYRFLYQNMPVYDWLSISYIIFEFCSLFLILKTIKNIVFKNAPDIILIRAVQILFTLFFTENIVYLSHTRPSLLFCGIAMVNLLFTDKAEKKDIFMSTLLFVFGMLIRPESSMGMILLVSTGYLIYRFDLKHLITRSFFPVAATAIMLSAYAYDWSHTDMFLKKMEPEVEYKLMEKRVVDISTMHTALDSIKYQAAVGGLCFDPKVLTPDYFRSVLLPGLDLSFAHATQRFFHVLSFYRYYLFVPCYGLLLLFLCLFQPSGKIWLFKISLFQLATFTILYALDYTGGLVAGRHFLNLQLISLLIISIYFFNSRLPGYWKRNERLGFGCLLVVILGAGINLINCKESSDNLVGEIACYETAVQGIDNLYSHRIIAFTTESYHIFDHVFTLKNKKYTNNTYLMHDVFTYWLTADYLNYLGNECNCDPLNPVVFFKWLSDKNALYISEPWHYELTSRYMELVHGQKIKFVPIEEYQKPACIADKSMAHFEIRKIVVEP